MLTVIMAPCILGTIVAYVGVAWLGGMEAEEAFKRAYFTTVGQLTVWLMMYINGKSW